MPEVETIYVRGEGGAVIAMDLPLPEGIADRLAKGQLRRVNEDGTPFHGPSVPDTADEPVADGQEPEASASADRPAQAAPKADWITYVVRRGLLSEEDAANYTKADLIAMVS